jgi:two-component system response regulator YesN
MYRILKNNRIFLGFVGSFFLLVVLTIGIGLLAYGEVNKMIRVDYVNTALSSLERGKELLETRMNEVDGIITQLSLNQTINYLNRPYLLENKDYYDLRTTSSMLRSYILANRFIDEVYIYWEKPGIIVSSTGASDNPAMYYDHLMQYKDMSYEEWKAKLKGENHGQNFFPVVMNKDGKEQSYLTNFQAINGQGDPTNRIFILVMINKENIASNFSYMEMLENGVFALSDAAGNPLLSINNGHESPTEADMFVDAKGLGETTLNGVPVIVLNVSSKLRGWDYTAAVPISYLEKKALNIKRMFEYATLIELIVGLLAAVIFSYRYSLPLKQTIFVLDKIFSNEKQNLRGIEGKVSRLVLTNRDMQTQLAVQLPLMRASFIERLLRGNIHHKDDIEAYLRYSDMNLIGDQFIAAVVELPTDRNVTVELIKDREILRVNARELLHGLFSGEALLHNMDDQNIVILLAHSGQENVDIESVLQTRLDEVLQKMYRSLNVKVFIGVGTACNDIIELSRSFQEACKALENKYAAGIGSIIWFNNLNYTYAGCYYPVDYEQRLINNTKNGDIEYVQGQLHHILTVNLQERSLTSSDKYQLYCEFRGTMLKIKEDLLQGQGVMIAFIDERIHVMDRCWDSKELFAMIENTFGELCRSFLELKSDKALSPIRKMLEIIHECFMDKDFYLHNLAAEFQLSEKYLSHYFKDQTGENFSAYLENLRIDKVVELMKDDNLTIKVIADMAGYDRTNTFYRAFKRKFGLSPTAYREQQGENHSLRRKS